MSTKRTVHGIDLNAPGGLAALLAHHRAMFGDAMMMADGEGGTGGEGAGSSGDNAVAEAAATAAAATAAAAADAANSKANSKADPWDDPETARAEIARLRKENGDARTTAKEQAATEARNEILAKLGLKEGDEPLNQEELAKQLAAKNTDLTASQETIRTLTIERALDKASRKAGADEDLLAAVLAHKGSLKDLDPSADDFATKLEAVVKSEVDGNPKLKAARAAGKSGTDFNGGPGETGKKVPLSLRDAAASHYSA